MAQEAELRIKSDSIEKTTSAIDALIGKLELLDKSLGRMEAENKKQEAAQGKTNTALKNAEIARKKAVEMLDLHKQSLGKLTDAFATEQAAIKAREIAAKKGISTDSEAYEALLKNVQATELAVVASKRLAEEEKIKAAETRKSANANKASTDDVVKKTAAEKLAETTLRKSNITRETAIELLKLEERGLDRLSDEYADAKGEILGMQQAQLKGIKSGTTEYDQLLKNTKATERATAARKKLTTATKDSTKGASKFTDGLDDVAKQAALVDGPLGGIASRLTTLSTILKSTGGIGGALALTGLGIGVALFTQQLARGISTAIESEVAYKTLEAQIEATGNAAGYSANQLDLMARSVAMGTLDNTENVRASIQSLLSFTSISSGIFEDIIRKSQDIAIVKGKSTKEVVNQLGKALDNPISKMETLAEYGLELSKEDKERISSLQTEGQLYEAQEIILGRLGQKFGDIARAQANTLAGDLDTVNQQWTELFETLGRGASGPLRTVVKNWSSWLELARQIAETDVETGLRKQREELQGLTTTSKDTEAELAKVRAELKELSEGSDDLTLDERLKRAAGSAMNVAEGMMRTRLAFFGLADKEIDLATRQDRFLTDKQKKAAVLLKTEEELVEKLDMQTGKYTDHVVYLTEAQKAARALGEIELKRQNELTKAFLVTGDTASSYYQKVKAGQDAIVEAKKRELDVTDESLVKVKEFIKTGEGSLTVQEKELRVIYENILATSKLTEKRVTFNTVLQKTKSLQAQQAGLEREVELYKATTRGIQKNSEAYIQLAASLKTANEIKSMGKDVTADQAKALQDENVELLKAQRNQAVLNALKAGDSNSANVATLNRQIKLQKLQASGVRKTSEEYIRQEERLKALDVIRKNNVATGSEEYIQLLSNAEAMADYRSQLQKTQDIADLGIVVRFDGMQQIEGSLAQIASAKAEALSHVKDLVDSGKINSEAMGEKIKKGLEEYFNDKANQVTIPLGYVITEEGKSARIESEEAINEEFRIRRDKILEDNNLSEIKNKQLQTELLVDLEAEKNDRLIAAEEAAAARRVDIWEASSDAIALTRIAQVSGIVSDGAKMLSAVSNNSKKLMKISKAAAIFQTSVSLTKSIAKATEAGWPANIPLIAEAVSTGTTLVNQAKSLNEPSFAFGGVDIQGAGTGRSDSIKANIARGESVVTASATSKHKSTLQRMNAGLPIGGGRNTTFSSAPSIVIQGDASERTVGLIELKLRDYEDRVQQIAQGVSQQTIQEENEVGGFLNPI